MSRLQDVLNVRINPWIYMQFIILIRIIFWHSLIKTGYHFVSRYWLKPDHAMQRLSHAVRPGHADWSPGSKVQSSRGALLEMPLRFFRTLLMMLPTPPEPCCRCFTPALGLLPAAGSLSCLIGNQTVQSPHRFNNPPLSLPLTTWNPSAAVPPPPQKKTLSSKMLKKLIDYTDQCFKSLPVIAWNDRPSTHHSSIVQSGKRRSSG